MKSLAQLRAQLNQLHSTYHCVFKTTKDGMEEDIFVHLNRVCNDIEQDIDSEEEMTTLQYIEGYLRCLQTICREPQYTVHKRNRQNFDGYVYNLKTLELAMNYNVLVSNLNENIYCHFYKNSAVVPMEVCSL